MENGLYGVYKPDFFMKKGIEKLITEQQAI